jgi:hypothetical protein
MFSAAAGPALEIMMLIARAAILGSNPIIPALVSQCTAHTWHCLLQVLEREQ